MQIPGRFWWLVLGSSYEATAVRVLTPCFTFYSPSASALRPVSEPYGLLQFVQLRRHSPTVRTLLCPGETRDHDLLAVYGCVFVVGKNKC